MEYLPSLQLHRPATPEDALDLRQEHPDACYLAGGTDMVVNVRRGIEQPADLIDLTCIEELSDITITGDGIRIGSTVTLKTLAAQEKIATTYAAVAEAANAVAGPTHRAYGTVGGNLCLDTRCLYYNQSEWWRESNDFCLKLKGTVCHVAPGGTFCFATFSGDLAPALLVYEAEVEILGRKGRRRMPLADFYRDDGMDHLTLNPGELVTAVHLPRHDDNASSGYAKSRVRGAIDFPLAGVAVRLRMDAGTVAELAVALTAVAPRPFLADGLDDLLGRPVDETWLEELRDLVRAQASPMRTTTTKPWYRRRVVGALAAKIARQLVEGGWQRCEP